MAGGVSYEVMYIMTRHFPIILCHVPQYPARDVPSCVGSSTSTGFDQRKPYEPANIHNTRSAGRIHERYI